MNVKELDRVELKNIVREILVEDASIIKETVKEMLEQYQSSQQSEKARDEKLLRIINKDFDKYDAVFRALA